MLINSQSLRGIYVAYNTLFNKMFQAQKPIYEQVATIVPSTTDTETYAWLGDMPGMREWIGDREIQNLSASDYSIKNKDFESTIGVPRNAIEDDKLGIYNPSVQMLAQSAAMHPDKLIFDLLGNGFTEKCYDGEAFFSTNHKVGKQKVSNKGTAKLTMKAYIAARTAIMSMIASSSESVLELHGLDRGMTRLKGETVNNYRIRLAMKSIIASEAGTNKAILYVAKAFGYDNVSIERNPNPEKWAEATVQFIGRKIVLDDQALLLKELNKIKPAGALLTVSKEQRYSATIYQGTVRVIGRQMTISQG